MKVRRFSLGAALGALCMAWLSGPPSWATNVAPMNLADLVKGSSMIVAGQVKSVNQGIDRSGLPYTEIEVGVSESIRGEAGSTLTFRQFGLQSPMPAVNGRKYVGMVAGMPRYTPGESVVLFLGRSSSLGLRTTLGLGQGRFTQHGGTLQNEIANSGLFKGVDFGSKRMNDKEKFMITTPQGGVDTATFTTLVRRAVNEKWWDGPKLKPRPGAPRPFAQTPSRMHTEGGGSHE